MGPGMMGYWGGYGYNSWWSVVPLLFWALIIGGGVLLVMALLRRDGMPDTGMGTRSPCSSALNVLRDHYARGEITKEQYEQMQRDLDDRE